jgi:hypothetical protein
MAEPNAMKRMWRTLRPRFSTVSTADPTAVSTALRAVPTAAAAAVRPVGWSEVLSAVGPSGAAVSVVVWACCMPIPSRHWEGDRYPAHHVREGCDEAHGVLLSLISDCAASGPAFARFCFPDAGSPTSLSGRKGG